MKKLAPGVFNTPTRTDNMSELLGSLIHRQHLCGWYACMDNM